jgi:hypothetical protein
VKLDFFSPRFHEWLVDGIALENLVERAGLLHSYNDLTSRPCRNQASPAVVYSEQL